MKHICRSLRCFAIMLVVVPLTAQFAHAQEADKRFELFAEAGASFSNKHTQDFFIFPGNIAQPASNTSSLLTTGRFFGGIRFWFDRHEALEASYSYSPSDLVFRDTCTPNCIDSSTTGTVRANFFAVNY
ncbi:MAG: hypothetical protein ACRD4A_10640, partial [Candidatus Acidiferrales bacterium]